MRTGQAYHIRYSRSALHLQRPSGARNNQALADLNLELHTVLTQTGRYFQMRDGRKGTRARWGCKRAGHLHVTVYRLIPVALAAVPFTKRASTAPRTVVVRDHSLRIPRPVAVPRTTRAPLEIVQHPMRQVPLAWRGC